MVTKGWLRKIAYGVIALLLIWGCVVVYRGREAESTVVPEILFLGDSLMGQYRDETSVPYLVGQELGKSTYNGAMGGTCLAMVNREEWDTFQKNAVSFTSLAHALAYGDFSVQKSARVRQRASEHFPQVLNDLSAVDMEQVECLVICYGTNDYFGGVPVSNPENVQDIFTLEGALRSSLEVLKEAFPEMRIILVTPTYNWYGATGDNCESIGFGGGYLKDYVDKLCEIAKEYGIEFLDLYTDFYPPGDFEEGLYYTTDGIHPNEAGRKKIAGAIADYIRGDEE